MVVGAGADIWDPVSVNGYLFLCRVERIKDDLSLFNRPLFHLLLCDMSTMFIIVE